LLHLFVTLIKVKFCLDNFRCQDDVQIGKLLLAPFVINDLGKSRAMDALGKSVCDVSFL